MYVKDVKAKIRRLKRVYKNNIKNKKHILKKIE